MNKHFSYLLALFCLLFVADVWGNISNHPVVPEIEIVSAEFGLFNSPESGKPLFVPTRSVPFIENQGYGWIIVIKTKKPKVKWREEFTLPSLPTTWGEGEKQGISTISSDRKTSVIERDVELGRGLISNAWAIAPGDPKGRYVIRVIIDGVMERTFEFEVQ
jgi:hypothetical protein